MPLAGNLKGATGATGAAGTGFTAKGAWTLSTVYAINDIYTHGGNTYRVTTGYTSGGTFGATDTSNTEVWAAAGAAGSTGSTGTAGAAGSVWFHGAGIPSDANGVNGDFYLNDTNSDYYQKAGGTWF